MELFDTNTIPMYTKGRSKVVDWEGIRKKLENKFGTRFHIPTSETIRSNFRRISARLQKNIASTADVVPLTDEAGTSSMHAVEGAGGRIGSAPISAKKNNMRRSKVGIAKHNAPAIQKKTANGESNDSSALGKRSREEDAVETVGPSNDKNGDDAIFSAACWESC